MEECKKRLVCILVSSYSMVWYGLHTSPLLWYGMVWCGLHTSPLSGRAGRPLVSAAWYGIHILAIYQSISGSARPYINPRWAASPSTFINTPRYIAPHAQHRHPLCGCHASNWKIPA